MNDEELIKEMVFRMNVVSAEVMVENRRPCNAENRALIQEAVKRLLICTESVNNSYDEEE